MKMINFEVVQVIFDTSNRNYLIIIVLSLILLIRNFMLTIEKLILSNLWKNYLKCAFGVYSD